MLYILLILKDRALRYHDTNILCMSSIPPFSESLQLLIKILCLEHHIQAIAKGARSILRRSIAFIGLCTGAKDACFVADGVVAGGALEAVVPIGAILDDEDAVAVEPVDEVAAGSVADALDVFSRNVLESAVSFFPVHLRSASKRVGVAGLALAKWSVSQKYGWSRSGPFSGVLRMTPPSPETRFTIVVLYHFPLLPEEMSTGSFKTHRHRSWSFEAH